MQRDKYSTTCILFARGGVLSLVCVSGEWVGILQLERRWQVGEREREKGEGGSDAFWLTPAQLNDFNQGRLLVG